LQAQVEGARQSVAAQAASGVSPVVTPEAIASVSKRIDDLESGVARQITGLQAQVEGARQSVAAQAASGVSPAVTPEAIANVSKRIDDLESGVARQITGLQAQVEGARQSVAAQAASGVSPAVTPEAIASVSKRIDDLESGVARQITGLQAQVEGTRQSVTSQGERLFDVSRRLEQTENAGAALEKRLASGEQALAAGQRADQDVARLVAELQAGLASLDTRTTADARALAENGAADAEALKRVTQLETGLTAATGSLGQAEAENMTQNERIAALEAGLASTAATAKEALERALAAGKLAEGKLLFTAVLTDDVTQFPFDKATLTRAAKTELNAFAEKLKTENQNVYIEVQGHTDNIGGATGNQALGLKRANAVVAYLNSEFGIPMHRMSALSYGESRPIASNKTKAGRAQNRRVVLVVLK
jgi:peptidoglycan-associated lipoprotein